MKGTTMTFLVKYKRRIVAAAVILCVLVLGINWKASISFAVETHEKILVGTEECLTKAVGALKAAFAQEQEVAPEEDNFYTLFSQQLVEKGSYRAYGLKRIQDSEGDRSYEFSISVSSSASGIQLSQGQEKTREVWKDGTYYQIDEANGAVVQTSTTEVYRDPLNQACAGKLVAERTIRQEGRSSTQYEIYNTGAVYCMTFDADGRLTHLESFRDDVWTEYAFEDLILGESDDELTSVVLANYQQVTEISAGSLVEKPDATLSLPPEYPVNELPLPTYYELSSVKTNLDENGDGGISITYFSSQSLEELKDHYVSLLQGSEGYGISDDVRDGERQITLCGSVSGWEIESVLLSYDSTRGQMKATLLMSN